MSIVSRRTFQKVGHSLQIGGMRRVEFLDGPEKGSAAVFVDTGAGFVFTVLLDRGMDISRAKYKGHSLAWLSPTGEAHPSRFDDKGLGWLRTFPGGLVTTCGLLQSGAPSKDGEEELGLHGRYTSLPASNVCQWEGWEEKNYVLRLSGEMREAVIFGENLVLRRELRTVLGQSGFSLKDKVTNEGFKKTPHMILYHCNFGYPLLDAGASLKTPHKKIEPRDADAEQGKEDACNFEAPVAGYREKVYFHHLRADRKGYVEVALTNPKLSGGLSVKMKYRLDQLPYFTQWKMMGKGEYVCGLEPGNALVLGRAAERAAGRLKHLAPGETVEYEIEFRVEEIRER